MKTPKLIIIGLDGGTFKIIDPLLKENKLPNLQKLIDTGTRAILKSTIPPLTPPAWISFMTGMNPGKHGFFDFRRQEKITYDSPIVFRTQDSYNLVHSGYYSGKTLWDILSSEGYKVSVLLMPMTYPSWPINGCMISGFPNPNFMKPNTFPPEWGDEIGSLFDTSVLDLKNEYKFVSECKRLIKRAGDILLSQLKKEEYDIYAVVFSSTDFAQHRLWKYLNEESSPYFCSIHEMYIEIDNILGEVLESIANNKHSIVILSDHGFTGAPKKYFHVNAWLRKEGYLSTKEKTFKHKSIDILLNPIRYQKSALKMILKKYFRYFPSKFQLRISNIYYHGDKIIWEQTRAFRYKFGSVEGIVINLADRLPKGIVNNDEYEDLKELLIEKLKNITDPETGIKIVKEIYRREEIFGGKFLDMVPDIIFVLNPEFLGGVSVEGSIITHVSTDVMNAFSGVHDRDGILILNGIKYKSGVSIDHVNIVDVFPTILFDLGLPIPTYADGSVIIKAFRKQFCSLNIEYKEYMLASKDILFNLSETEEEAMKKALKGLGYL